jgi:hypothetical protein
MKRKSGIFPNICGQYSKDKMLQGVTSFNRTIPLKAGTSDRVNDGSCMMKIISTLGICRCNKHVNEVTPSPVVADSYGFRLKNKHTSSAAENIKSVQ